MSENNGCYRDATIHGFIQPTMSARLRSVERFSFRFGRMEIRAKMPSGDWLWPGRLKFLLDFAPTAADKIKNVNVNFQEKV